MADQNLAPLVHGGNRDEQIARVRAEAHCVVDAIFDLLGASASTPAIYSNERRELYPPRCTTKRAARDRIARVPGAERLGSGKATIWSVSREAYAAHYGARRVELRVVERVLDEEQAAIADLEAARLRPTSRRRAS